VREHPRSGIVWAVLLLLPPSETKAPGGDGAPLAFDALSLPELNPVRRKIADALVELADDVPASMTALGLSARQTDEVERNAELYRAPTMPALQRYTGVLYDALEAGGFDTTQWSRAGSRLAVASALFGLLGPDDPIPAYRLSGNSTLPALGPLRTLWRPALEPLLAARDDLVVDLRSGTYATLARVPGAVTVRVVTADSAGNRKTVSHHNKAYKGALAATLATSATEPSTVDELLTLTSRSGLNLTRTDENTLELLTD